ncbi:3-mercaptopyruvate sulfurtransferase [Phenylobacterium sp. J426]|uniref:3-mercaptopyruvate sulfurtransferase n=1 Tax=Phenylobacterium sp. J426 TaxID=2898439 RepID=UPI002151E294|nr:3-mercaptopyruvate sulfurtransferase [Phenylobacterium sp. J426]MCR5875723.1 3-mercaptopyruvate sulfurtransferase [Phenylobacterium sp. J426]
MTDPMVSTDWLEARLHDPEIRIVDATLPLVGQPGRGRDTYEAAHIPGAVFFDINVIADPTTDLPHMLPTAEAFAEAAGSLGLGRSSTIVVYDAHGLYSAPRVWWTLRAMGYPNVFVLDGGLRKWRAEGRVVVSDAAAPAPVATDTAFRAELVRDLAEVRRHLEAGDAQLLDARSQARFSGQAPEPRAGLRSGHMPGALNLPFDGVVAADGTLKPEGELREAFAGAGVDLGRPIVTTCGSGVTAAVLALALARLGVDDVAVYDGSWTEWGGRPDTAVVTGG